MCASTIPGITWSPSASISRDVGVVDSTHRRDLAVDDRDVRSASREARPVDHDSVPDDEIVQVKCPR